MYLDQIGLASCWGIETQQGAIDNWDRDLVDILIFYLVLRALDTVEDDMDAFAGDDCFWPPFLPDRLVFVQILNTILSVKSFGEKVLKFLFILFSKYWNYTLTYNFYSWHYTVCCRFEPSKTTKLIWLAKTYLLL